MEWRWLNEHRLTFGLDKCPDDELDDVLDALDALLDDPAHVGLTSPLRGDARHRDRTLALLPHGWVLVYSVCSAGVPPAVKYPSLVVRYFGKFVEP